MISSFLSDLGIASIFILISFLLRSWIKPIQRLFIPVSVIAGLLLLILGPNGLEWATLSKEANGYPGIFICFIFAALPFTFQSDTSKKFTFRNNQSIIRMTIFIGSILFLQWGLGMLFSLTLLQTFLPNLHNGFGGLIAAGFFGGHGTAAAVGESFTGTLNWNDVGSLAMTSATVGIFASTFGGILLVQWGISTKNAQHLDNIEQLPTEFRTGLVPISKQTPIGKRTFSSIAIDPLLMHFILILLLGLSALFLSKQSNIWLNGYSIAGFSIAFFLGLITKFALQKVLLLKYFDSGLVLRICGLFTDLLVVFGIAVIKVEVVLDYAIPLILIFAFGIIVCLFCFRWLGAVTFSDNWFEASLFTWGWVTGVTAMGITLLRMVDSENKTSVLRDFAIAYLFISPFEVLFLVIFPIFIANNWVWAFTVGSSLIGIGLAYWLFTNPVED